MALISGPTVEAAISDPQSELSKLVASEKDDTKLVAEIFLRVLNRPATTQEIEVAMAALRRLPEEHKQLTARLEEGQKQSAAVAAQQEQERQKAIARAKQEVEAYEKQTAPQVAAQERERQQQIAKAEAALRESEKTLPQRMAAWEQQAKNKTAWTPLVASKLTASNKAKLTQETDRAVIASGPNGNTTYVFVALERSGEHHRTAARSAGRQAFTRERPRPGAQRQLRRSPSSSSSGIRSRSRRRTSVSRCRTRRPTSARTSYNVQTAIGESPDKGWAVAPQTGQSHTAVFETHDEYCRSGNLHDPHGPEFRRRPAYSRPVPHLGDQCPAADHL